MHRSRNKPYQDGKGLDVNKEFSTCCFLVFFLAISCAKDPAQPIPPSDSSPFIRFSINSGPMHSFTCGPDDILMDEAARPFITIHDAGTGDWLYLYASAEENPYTISGSAIDYIIIRIAVTTMNYSGTYTSGVLINLCADGTSYLNTSANSLTLDASVSSTSVSSTITGTFSGLIDLSGSNLPVSGSFSIKHMNVSIPSGG